MNRFMQRYIAPIAVPMGAMVVIGALIIAIGQIYLGVHDASLGKDNIRRPELWISIVILLGVIALMALLTRMPGPLDKDVVIGGQTFWDDAADVPPVDPRAVHGEPGFLEDIQPGYTLYAQSGKLARVVGSLPGGRDYGRTYKGLLHAEGLGFAAKEMWIPVEAVSAVYPESQSAFLAIKGDEAESFGWTLPPEGMTRGGNR